MKGAHSNQIAPVTDMEAACAVPAASQRNKHSVSYGVVLVLLCLEPGVGQAARNRQALQREPFLSSSVSINEMFAFKSTQHLASCMQPIAQH